MRSLEQLGFNLVGYGCTTCIGNSGPLPPADLQGDRGRRPGRRRRAVSGNRNFEGRVHPEVRANYLASPPLVVAYALAGRIDIDLDNEPLGTDTDGKPVYLQRHLADASRKCSDAVGKAVQPEMFQQVYGEVFKGDEHWRNLDVPDGRPVQLGAGSRPTSSTRPTSRT